MYPTSRQRRRKKRPTHIVRVVEVPRGQSGYGFTISGEQPCVLSCIVSGSNAERKGLKTGDFLMAVNNQDVSQAGHDDVVRLIGRARGSLTLHISETIVSSDSSDEEYVTKQVKKSQGRRYKKSYDDLAMAHSGDRTRVNKYKHRHALEPSSRSRSQSPGRFLDEDPIEQPHRRSRGIENINPQHQSRSRHRHSSKNTKHTIITREHRLGLVNSQIPADSYSARSAFHQRHVRDLSSSSSSSANTFLPQPSGDRGQREFLHPPPPHPSHQHQQQYPGRDQAGHRHGRQVIEDLDFDDNDSMMYGEDIQVVVGYVGTIEFPHSSDKLPSGTSARFHALQTAIRRLRLEKRVHTLILMQVDGSGVKLINSVGGMVAFYPAQQVCDSAICPEDERRFFGIATAYNSPNEGVEEQQVRSSCHVFMVNPEMAYHSAHASEARTFAVQCVNVPGTGRCKQFPVSAKFVVSCISLLHQETTLQSTSSTTSQSDMTNSGRYDQASASSNLAVSNQLPDMSTSNATNDSALGAHSDQTENPNRVCVVEMHTEPGDTSVSKPKFSDSMTSFNWHFEDQVTSTPLKSPTKTAIDLNAGLVAPEDSFRDTQNDRLGVRARPNPFGYIASPDTQANAEQIRKAVPRVLNSQTSHLQHRQHEVDENDLETIPHNVTDDIKAQMESPVPPLPPRLPAQNSNMSLHGCADLGQAPKRDRASSPSKTSSATIGKKTGASPLPVSIPQVPDLAKKPPLPASKLEKRNPFSRLRTPKRQPVERPKSTPPIRGFDPEVPIPEEEYESDPGELSALTNNFEESWSGRIPESNETPMKLNPRGDKLPDIRRHSDGMALLQNKKDDGGASLAGKISKSGSFKHFKQKPRGQLDAQDSLVGPSEAAGENENPATQTSSAPSSTIPTRPRINNAASTATIACQQSVDVTGAGAGADSVVGRAASWAVGFDKLLADKVGLNTFTEFLKKEYSQENITFWTKVENYKCIEDDAQRKKRAQEIYDEHLTQHASELVNVDAASRSATEQSLATGEKDVFAVTQKHIYNLMKQDSYTRFLKSPLYKDSVLAEMEGRPLPFSEDAESIDSFDSDRKSLKKQPSGSSTEEGGEKRRRSLLPWNRNKTEKRVSKVGTDNDARKNSSNKRDDRSNNNAVRSSLELPDVKQISKELAGKEGEDVFSDNSKEQKFCRVLLPDGSTTVLDGVGGEKLATVLGKLCDRRNLVAAQLDVYIVGQDKPLDTSCDFSSVAAKELRLERRVVFRLDLPSLKRSIGVKGRVQQTIGEVVKAAAPRMGVKMENMTLYKYGTNSVVDVEANVLSMENQRLVLQNSDDFSEWGGLKLNRSNGIMQRSKSTDKSQTPDATLDAMFKEVFEGNATFNGLFDEHGILDPESKKPQPPPRAPIRSSSSSSSGVVSRLFNKSAGGSGGSHQEPAAPSVATRVNKPGPTSRKHDAEVEKVIDLLSRAGGRRLDDQRGYLRPQDLELPDFLVHPTPQISAHAPSNGASPASKRPKPDLRSASSHDFSTGKKSPAGVIVGSGVTPAMNGTLRKTPLHNSDSSLYDAASIKSVKKSASQESFAPGSCVSARSLHISPSKIPFMDQSFGENGVVPSHAEADEYFSPKKYTDSLNFEKSRVMERTLQAISLESKPRGNSPRNAFSLSKVQANTPISEYRQRLSSPLKLDENVVSPRRSQPMLATAPAPSHAPAPAPVPKPRVPKRKNNNVPVPPPAASSSRPAFAVSVQDDTQPVPGAYIAQDGDVEITLLPPSSTDSDDSERFSSPPPPPSTQGTLSKTDVANYPAPAPLASKENSPLPTPPIRSKRRPNGSSVKSPRGNQTPPKPARRPDRFPKKFDSSSRSETSTPSPTTHDLILEGFGNVPKDSVAVSESGRRENGRVGGRTKRVLAVEYEEEDKDVQVSYV